MTDFRMDPIIKIQEAWQTAATELGIEFVSPFCLGEGTEAVNFHGLVVGFGCEKGTVFLASSTFREELSVFSGLAASNGYCFSLISADSYGSFNRVHFLDTLKDWGWHSKDRIPPHGFSLPIRTEKRKRTKR